MRLFLSVILLLLTLVGCGPFGGQAIDPPETIHTPSPYPAEEEAAGDSHLEEGINWDISSESTSTPSNQYPETKAVQVQEAKFIYVVDGGEVRLDQGDIPAQLQGYSSEQIQNAIRGQLKGVTQAQLDRLSPEQLQQMIQKQLGATPAPKQAPTDATPTKPQAGQQAKEPAPAEQQTSPEQAALTPAAPQKPATEQRKEQAPAPQTEGISTIEAKVIELTNEQRRKNGLSDLKGDTQLSGVARKKSTDMQQNNYFSHTSPTYGSPFDMMRDHGVQYSAAAENIAQGQQTAEEVVQAWMNSEGHRKNILNGNFTHIGVGYDKNGHHWTQMFIKK